MKYPKYKLIEIQYLNGSGEWVSKFQVDVKSWKGQPWLYAMHSSDPFRAMEYINEGLGSSYDTPSIQRTLEVFHSE